MKKLIYLSFLTLCITFAGVQQTNAQESKKDTTYLYKSIVLQAAPGKLGDLIDKMKSDLKAIKDAGEEPGYMFRHSQGDKWDLMVTVPIKSYEDYYKSKTSKILERKYGSDFYDLIGQQQEAFVRGPSLKLFKKIFNDNSFFHAEMFVSLGGKQNELFKERERENIFSLERGSIYNMIFTRENGYAWDIFTIGGYKDFAHYADTNINPKDEDAAAKKAGFDKPGDIGIYLRSLIKEHNDTLGNKVDY